MNNPALAAFKVRFILSSKDASRNEKTITTCAEVVSYLPQSWATVNVIAKADE